MILGMGTDENLPQGTHATAVDGAVLFFLPNGEVWMLLAENDTQAVLGLVHFQ